MALFRSLVLENAGTPLRVNLLYLAPVATRGRSASPERITAAEVGKHAAYLASDAARMVAGSVVQLGRRPPYA
jgi:NAD(P)-dependent dehydrogenase (short-subunit alcohol dehydrogenase family)